MIKKPLISILMNCFNGELYLREALDSLISQDYKNWELIFWDNKSKDSSLEIVSSYKDKRIRIFRSLKHTNLGEARKNAFKKAKGEYLAFLDVDDLWRADKLKNQIKFFEDKSIGIVFTNTLFFSKKASKNLYNPSHKISVNTSSLITNYCLPLVSTMIDIQKIKLLKYDFDKNYSHISDFDLFIRISAISKVKYLNEVSSAWRIHNNNESFKKKELFNMEVKRWCNFHLKNKYLTKYIDEINELKMLTLAQDRILMYNFNFLDFFELLFSKISSFKNRLFILTSYIPLIPKLIYIYQMYKFKSKWY